jgi:uncharacterized protein (TIGR02145 family)
MPWYVKRTIRFKNIILPFPKNVTIMKKDLFYKCLSIIAFFSLTLFLSYCIKYGPSPVFVDQGDIGSDGGIVKTNDGASVEIPAGALSTNTNISITNITENDTNDNTGYRIYELKPDGLVFNDSIIIMLPFEDRFLNTIDTIDNQTIRVFLVQDSSLCEIKAMIDLQNNLAVIKTVHFSKYLVIFPSEWGDYFKNRGDKSVTLTVPYYEQFRQWCFYYSLSMILKNEGYNYKGPYLASKCLERDPNNTGFYTVLDDGLLSFMAVLGINFNYKQFWFNKVNLFGYIINCIDDNRPVELLVTDAEHAIVVTGYDKYGLYIHDPNFPSSCENYYSYKDISRKWIGDGYCNTLIIRSAGKDLKSSYTLNFHDYDIRIKEDPNNSTAIGRLRINGLYKPSGYAIVATSSQADRFGYIIPGSFDGKDYMVLNPIFANADNLAKTTILQVKFDANEIPRSQRLIEIPPNNLNYKEDEPIISRLENLNKGLHTVTVELRSEDNLSLYDSWQFDINIANEFIVAVPTAAFTATPRTIMVGQSVQFTDQSTNNPTSWSWNFGDGGTSTLQNPSHTYSAAGTYTVTLTTTNSAGSDGETKTGYITVNPSVKIPVAAFTSSPRTITAGQSVQFTDQSTNNPTSWSWSFGDGGTSTLQNPSHTYSTAGTYTVTLTATNSAGSDGETKTGYITINPSVIAPVAAFTGSPRTITAGQNVQFTDQSTNNPTSWSWSFGDGGTSTTRNPSHVYNTAGTFTVTLTATNSAGSDGETKTGYITVNPSVIAPVAAFTGSPRTITAGQNVQFTDQSTNNPTSWSWSFGDGATSTSRNPSHTYSTAGVYTIRLTATNSAGSDEEIKNDYITVNPESTGIIFNPNLTYGSVTDIDGNVYKTIQIGTQTWMAENLRAITLNDGTSISLVESAIVWDSLSTSAYCWYDNNRILGNTFGALYNWYVVGTLKLCPLGWHVPSLSEWSLLLDYLGGAEIAFYKLRETTTTHWEWDTNVTNESGFSAIPGGYRIYYGEYRLIGNYAGWWTSTVGDLPPYEHATVMSLRTVDPLRYGYHFTVGHSVRCLKD